MDKTTKHLVDYTRKFSRSDLGEAGLTAAVNHLFDTIAVSIAGTGSEPGHIAAKVAGMVHSDQPATVFGYGVQTSPELAALANAMAIRTYDYNDGMAARGGGHPSDMISGVLAAGETAHSSGLDVLVAISLAYEILGGIGWNIPDGWSGFDQGTFMNVGVALAAGKLWGLNDEQLANAASLALVPNLPLGVSRWGELSMMKGCATAFATRNGVFAAMLAREGFTSAPEPFEGIYGLWHQTQPFEPRVPVDPDGMRVIQMSHMKAWPAEGNVQVLMDLAPKIREFTPYTEIESIDVEIPEHFVIHLADEPKYDPKTRETADHSLPYMLAIALIDGEITLESYRPERFLDPSLRPFLRKIRVTGSKELSDIRQNRNIGVARPTPVRIKVHTTSGREFSEEVLYHKGHMTNPLTRDDLNAKFDRVCAGVSTLSNDQREKIREAWWNVAGAADIGEPIKTMVGFRQL